MATLVRIAWPLGPMYVTFGPIACSTSATWSKAARSPPTMTDIWPAASVAGLPETGQSRNVAPVAATRSASATLASGAIVLMSAQTVPGRMPSSTALGDLLDRRRVGEHREQHVDGSGELARRLRPAHPRLEQRLRPGLGAVPSDHVVAGVEQPLRDARAHRAEPGEPDSLDPPEHPATISSDASRRHRRPRRHLHAQPARAAQRDHAGDDRCAGPRSRGRARRRRGARDPAARRRAGVLRRLRPRVGERADARATTRGTRRRTTA